MSRKKSLNLIESETSKHQQTVSAANATLGILAALGLLVLWCIAAFFYYILMVFSAGENNTPNEFMFFIYLVVLAVGIAGVAVRSVNRLVSTVLLAAYFGLPAVCVLVVSL